MSAILDIVWSGGALLPPRPENTAPIYTRGFEARNGDWTPEYKKRPKSEGKRKPKYHMPAWSPRQMAKAEPR